MTKCDVGFNSLIPDTSVFQVILVSADAKGPQLTCFEKSNSGLWEHALFPGGIPAWVGKNGISAVKREGDGCTPAGFFPLGHAFGCREKPATALPYKLVTPHSYWVDDPLSRFYNTWVDTPVNPSLRTEDDDWNSAERLAAYRDSYAYAVVIEYNTQPVQPGKGSAIFLHCGQTSTAGCVAISESAMLKVLGWLDPAKKPCILIFKNSVDICSPQML